MGHSRWRSEMPTVACRVVATVAARLRTVRTASQEVDGYQYVARALHTFSRFARSPGLPRQRHVCLAAISHAAAAFNMPEVLDRRFSSSKGSKAAGESPGQGSSFYTKVVSSELPLRATMRQLAEQENSVDSQTGDGRHWKVLSPDDVYRSRRRTTFTAISFLALSIGGLAFMNAVLKGGIKLDWSRSSSQPAKSESFTHEAVESHRHLRKADEFRAGHTSIDPLCSQKTAELPACHPPQQRSDLVQQVPPVAEAAAACPGTGQKKALLLFEEAIDTDQDFDPRSHVYEAEKEKLAGINRAIRDEEEREAQQVKQFGLFHKAKRYLSNEEGATDAKVAKLESKRRRRFADRFRPRTAPPRQASLITIGMAQLPCNDAPGSLGRCDFAIIPHNDNKWFYAGLVSGHGGWETAEFVRQQLKLRLRKSVLQNPPHLVREAVSLAVQGLDSSWRELCGDHHQPDQADDSSSNWHTIMKMGASVLVTLIDSDSILIGNLGACQAVISREGTPYRLSRWHSADSLFEQRLILKQTGREDNVLRCARQHDQKRKVEGIVAVPFWATNTLGFDTLHNECFVKGISPVLRGIGFLALKDADIGGQFQEMTASQHYPYVHNNMTINLYPRTKYDDFLILGSPQFWNLVPQKEAVGLVQQEMNRRKTSQGMLTDYAQIGCQLLIAQALENHAAQCAAEAFQDSRPRKQRRISQLHPSKTNLALEDITVVVIPLNVDGVKGVPNLTRDALATGSSIRRYVQDYVLGPERSFETADWMTKFSHSHSRHCIRPGGAS